jgi:hypothetical protein
MDPDSPLELTVLMPCLNEADTIQVCVGSEVDPIRSNAIASEVSVAEVRTVEAGEGWIQV